MGVGLLQAVQGAGLVEEGPVGPAIHLVSLGMFFCWTSIRLLAVPHREGVLGSGMEQGSCPRALHFRGPVPRQEQTVAHSTKLSFAKHLNQLERCQGNSQTADAELSPALSGCLQTPGLPPGDLRDLLNVLLRAETKLILSQLLLPVLPR